MTPDEIKSRLEEAGRTLMMLPVPKNGYPAGHRSHWPEVVRTAQEFFAAQVMADRDHREEMLAGRNAVRIRPQQRQTDEAWEALEWVYAYIHDPKLRKIAFARCLKHPMSDRHLISYGRLGREFGLHRNTVITWHDKAIGLIAQGLVAECAKCAI